MPLSPADVDSKVIRAEIRQPVDLTQDQQDRRQRIFDAAVEVASGGGFEVLQMRETAAAAGVAPATLYRYFPSKVHLLVAALAHRLALFDRYLHGHLGDVSDPFSRLRFAVTSLIAEMESRHHFTEALTHAYAASCFVAAPQAQSVRDQTSAMFARIMCPGESEDDDTYRDVADILADVWTTSMLSLVQQRSTFDDLRRHMATTIDLLVARQGAL